MTVRAIVLAFGVVAIIGLLVAGILFGLHAGSAAPEPAGGVCTLEAKQCPDGSYVGRIPPSCDFGPCPLGTTTPDVKG